MYTTLRSLDDGNFFLKSSRHIQFSQKRDNKQTNKETKNKQTDWCSSFLSVPRCQLLFLCGVTIPSKDRSLLSFYTRTTAEACYKECLKPKICLITAYRVLINKREEILITHPYLPHMSRRGITAAWFNR